MCTRATFGKIFEVISSPQPPYDSVDAPAVQMLHWGPVSSKQILLHTQIIYEKHSTHTGNFLRIPPVMKLLSDGSHIEGFYDRTFVPCLHISNTERGREGGNDTNYAEACAVTAVIVEHIKRRVRNTYSTLYFS